MSGDGRTILVCGGRNYADRTRAHAVLNGLHAEIRISVVAHGDASGADRMAAGWAMDYGVTSSAYIAQWERDGRAAGPIRNARMLAEAKPSLVVAFPGGRGTADMMRRARAAGVLVMEVKP